jgi:5-methylcytosine-specific restriction endonuclease McrA
VLIESFPAHHPAIAGSRQRHDARNRHAMIVRMTRTFLELSRLTNRALLARVDELVRRERRVQAALIANLSELDARRLYLDEGCSSFYAYCVERLGYSESAAYRRMEAARAARRFPVVLERLGNGALNLTTVALLAKHLTAANHRELLDAAAGKSKGEVEALIARVAGVFAAVPRSTVRVVQVAAPVTAPPGGAAAGSTPANPTDITESTSAGGSNSPTMPLGNSPGAIGRAVPRSPSVGVTESTSAGGSDPAGSAPTSGAPGGGPTGGAPGAGTTRDAPGGAPDTILAYRHAITLTAEEQADLERARELLRTLIPNGDPARIVEKALRQLVATLEARKFGAVRKPRAARTSPPRATRTANAPETRAIPAAVRRAVTARDAGRCTFVSAGGHRCTERGALEFHHRTPVAKDGPTSPDNLTLLCARHHRQESERQFGPAEKFAAARITSAGGSAPPGPGG